MERPTAAQVRALLPQAPWATLGYALPVVADPPPDPLPDDPLQTWVDMSADVLEETTGQTFAAMPTRLERIALLATAMLTVQGIGGVSGDQLEAYMGSDVLSGFNADGYSEQYREQGAVNKSMRDGWLVNPWAQLNRLLWLLMTPQKQAYWIAYFQGGGIPSWGVTEVDWSMQNRGVGVAGPVGTYSYPGIVLPPDASTW